MSIKITNDKMGAFMRGVEALGTSQVVVGVVAGNSGRSDEGVSNAMLAALHELGSGAKNIPPRPFLAPGLDSNRDQIIAAMKAATIRAAKGDAIGLERVGLIAQTSVKKYITNSANFQALAPSTIAARQRKGFAGTKPLIQTGSLLNSITYEVRDGGN